MTSDEAGKMLAKENTGFSLDGSVSIPSWDHFGLERLLKYCGRPSFSSENIRWNGKKVTYKLPKPNRRGQTSIQLDPIELQPLYLFHIDIVVIILEHLLQIHLLESWL